MGGAQGCCLTSHCAQDSLHHKESPGPSVGIAEREKPLQSTYLLSNNLLQCLSLQIWWWHDPRAQPSGHACGSSQTSQGASVVPALVFQAPFTLTSAHKGQPRTLTQPSQRKEAEGGRRGDPCHQHGISVANLTGCRHLAKQLAPSENSYRGRPLQWVIVATLATSARLPQGDFL